MPFLDTWLYIVVFTEKNIQAVDEVEIQNETKYGGAS
jgi:hypothetical protein